MSNAGRFVGACRLWWILGLWALAPAAAADDPDPEGLRLASVQAAVADLESGEVLYAKASDRVVPIASVTKLMTAMVVLDAGADLEQWVEIVERKEAPPNNAYSRMRIGSELRRGDLLRIMLMASENLAAHVLARQHEDGVPGFVAAMNRKAEALGMRDTTFAGPSGLSERNRSTAADLLKLVRAALTYDEIQAYTRATGYTARFRRPRYSLRYGNTNPLVHRGRWSVTLSKTGYLDAAGRCLVMVTEIDERPVGVVLLDSFGTRTPIGDAGRVRRWLETGEGGSVAGAAQAYERRKSAAYAEAERETLTADNKAAATAKR